MASRGGGHHPLVLCSLAVALAAGTATAQTTWTDRLPWRDGARCCCGVPSHL